MMAKGIRYFRRAPVAAILAAASCSLLAVPGIADAAWAPTRPISFVVTGGSGGGADQMARMIQSIVAKHKFSKEPMIVTIENGGGGGQGFIDLKESQGNPEKIMIALANLYTVPLTTNLPFNWRDTTPVALMALDQFVLWVNSKSPYHTATEYINAVKSKPNTFKMGGAGAKREDEVATRIIEQATGAKFKFIPYRGGGEITAQLVGQHINSDVNNPIEHAATWRSGQVRPLCVMDSERMPYKKLVVGDMSWNSVPTCKSEGIDAEYQMIRGIFMPKGVTSDQVEYYTNLLKKVVQTKEWKEYIERGAYKNLFLTGKAFSDYLQKDEAKTKDIMISAGMISGK
ncbi:MAG TPA: tripartite tricarboxylate transporter substrate-binding protein [Castellaniella sp.]|uniref:Bug family tripartite tricarboxylate transporter substrate binding protein n=1 Tax=Castellaniella sp. TaxID=1955812 RepID=UPI002EFCEE64